MAIGPTRVVDGVTFDLAAGEIHALVGESGCGKSMTGFAIMGLLPPVARCVGGRVLLEGTDLLTLSEAEMRRVRGGRVSIIFQEPTSSSRRSGRTGRFAAARRAGRRPPCSRPSASPTPPGGSGSTRSSSRAGCASG